jgi:ABC-type multidrug transport system ATPase subunit
LCATLLVFTPPPTDLGYDQVTDVHDAYAEEHHQCEVGFEGIRLTLERSAKKGGQRVILDGSIKGLAKPGRMMAIMGPSGSGKTTLLNAIAGRIQYSKNVNLYGQRYLNGNIVPGESRVPAAFIEQEVEFFPHMTVKETLDFRVELKLGKTVSKSDRDELTRELLELLGLTKSTNTIVGNAKIRGISGGERKRLSIACEMIDSPPIIFLDEPTSGLDAYQAAQVVQTMRRLTDNGKTVVAVIHQPSQRVFSLFDDLLLLSEGGRQMYFGPVDEVRSHFDAIGYGCTQEEGTAEHILDVVSSTSVIGDGGSNDEKASNGGTNPLSARLDSIAVASAKQVETLKVSNGGPNDPNEVRKLLARTRSMTRPAASIFLQFKLLLKRSLQETLRGKGVILIKLVQQVTIGLLYGGIYSVGNDQASIIDRIGLLSLVTIGTANMSVAGTIRAFPKEKAIVMGEITSRLYRVFPYFISKAISEIPLIGFFSGVFASILYPLVGLQNVGGKFKNFLLLTSLHSTACQATGLLIGAVSPSSDFALALFPPLIVLSVIFDGRNISEENIPKLLRWVPKVGLIKTGYTGLAINEFEGLEFTSKGPYRGPVLKTGEQALERFGITGTLTDIIKSQMGIICGAWFLSFMGLSLTKERFEVMQSPSKK